MLSCRKKKYTVYLTPKIIFSLLKCQYVVKNEFKNQCIYYAKFSLNKYETLIIAIPVPDERKCHMGPKFKLGFFLQKIRQIDGEDLEYLATQFHDYFFILCDIKYFLLYRYPEFVGTSCTFKCWFGSKKDEVVQYNSIEKSVFNSLH